MSVRSAIFLCALAALAAGCGSGGEAGVARPVAALFPPEKDAQDFPGIDYPTFEEGLTPPGQPVWVVGIDGATWDLIVPLAAEGQLPTFKRLMEEGATTRLLSEEPTLSPALWATVATGLPRFEHGIVNFVERRRGSYETRKAGPIDRRAPALWELVGAAGGTSAVVGWFNSFPAEAIAGHYVSKGVRPDAPQLKRVWPASLVESLPANYTPPFDEATLAAIGRNPTLAESVQEDAALLGALGAVTRLAEHDLVVAHFSIVDVAQHLTWRDMDPTSDAFSDAGAPRAQLAEVIPDSYRLMDAALAKILDWMPAEATLVVLSDHGGGPMRPERAYHLQLDVLLTEMGLMDGDSGSLIAIDELYRHEKRIWLNLEEVEPNGQISMDKAPGFVERLEGRLKALQTDEGYSVFAEIDNRFERDDWQPGDPAFVVRFAEGALLAQHVLDRRRLIDFGPVRMRHSDVSGDHRPDGILILRGPGIAAGQLKAPANLYNVAPTVLQLLGLPQDARMLAHAPADGGVLTAALVGPPRPRMIAAFPGTEHGSRLEPLDAAGEDAVSEEQLERLKSLGYLR